MKRLLAVGLMACCSVVVTACENTVDLRSALAPFAETNVPFDPAHATVDADGVVTLKGALDFTNLHHFTNHRTECDTVQCGTETQRQCEPVQRCENVYQCWNETRCHPEQRCNPVQRCTGGGQVCENHPVCRDVRDSVCHTGPGGQQVCQEVTRRVCTDNQVCHTTPPVCHMDNVCHTESICRQEQECGYRPVCHTDSVCRDVQVPRYCQENCRDVAFPDTELQRFSSAITVKIKGLDKAKFKDQLKQLVLVVKPNDKFRSAMDDASQRPKGSDATFNSVEKADKTLVVMSAKGVALARGQKVLELPANFKPGDSVTIELVVEATSSKDLLSAAGSKTDFPKLASED